MLLLHPFYRWEDQARVVKESVQGNESIKKWMRILTQIGWLWSLSSSLITTLPTKRVRVSPRALRNQAFLFWVEKLKPREVNLLSKTKKIPQCTSRKKSTFLWHQLFLNIPLRRKWAETLWKASLLVPAVTLTKALFWERFPSFSCPTHSSLQDMTYWRVSVRGSQSWWFSNRDGGWNVGD